MASPVSNQQQDYVEKEAIRQFLDIDLAPLYYWYEQRFRNGPECFPRTGDVFIQVTENEIFQNWLKSTDQSSMILIKCADSSARTNATFTFFAASIVYLTARPDSTKSIFFFNPLNVELHMEYEFNLPLIPYYMLRALICQLLPQTDNLALEPRELEGHETMFGQLRFLFIRCLASLPFNKTLFVVIDAIWRHPALQGFELVKLILLLREVVEMDFANSLKVKVLFTAPMVPDHILLLPDDLKVILPRDNGELYSDEATELGAQNLLDMFNDAYT